MIQFTVVRQPHILAISGSLRSGSFNTALLREATRVAPDGAEVEIADIAEFPMYNRDVELDAGVPTEVAAVRARLAEADGLLLASPEYNFSITGALKNAIDWLSRSPSPLDRIPTAIMGTGGRLGTARAQAHLREMLMHNEADTVVRPEVLVPGLSANFDENGTVINERASLQIAHLMEALCRRIADAAHRSPRVLVEGDDDDVAVTVRLLHTSGFRSMSASAAARAGIDLEQVPFQAIVTPSGAEPTVLVSAGVPVLAGTNGELVDELRRALST